MIRFRRILLVAILVLLAGDARAETLVSNLGENRFPSLPIVGTNQWLAASFITGPAPSLVESVTFVASTGGTSGEFQLAIYDSAGGLPGAPLSGGVLSGSTAPNGPGNDGVPFEYVATSPLTLAPDTRYWLVASSTLGTFTWKSTTSFGEDSAFGWTIENYDSFSSNQGASWVDGSQATRPTIGLFAIRGTVTAIPEPSTLALVAPGLLGVAIGRRALRRRSRP